jgi:hypothetical protein
LNEQDYVDGQFRAMVAGPLAGMPELFEAIENEAIAEDAVRDRPTGLVYLRGPLDDHGPNFDPERAGRYQSPFVRALT